LGDNNTVDNFAISTKCDSVFSLTKTLRNTVLYQCGRVTGWQLGDSAVELKKVVGHTKKCRNDRSVYVSRLAIRLSRCRLYDETSVK